MHNAAVRTVAAALTAALLLGACTDNDEPQLTQEERVELLAAERGFGGQPPADATEPADDTQRLTPVSHDDGFVRGNPDEVYVVLGNKAATLTEAETADGIVKNPGTAALVQAVDGDRLVATAISVSAADGTTDDIVLDASSTADALILATPGMTTADPTFVTLTLEVARTTDQYTALVDLLDEEADSPTFDLDEPSDAVLDATSAAVDATRAAFIDLLDEAESDAGDTVSLPDAGAVAFVGAQTEAEVGSLDQVDPRRGPACDDSAVLVPNDAELEVDNVCFVEQGTDADGLRHFDITNHGTRWVMLDYDADRKADMFVPPATVESLTLSDVPGYAKAEVDRLMNLPENGWQYIEDKLSGQNDRVLDYYGNVREVLDGLDTPTIVKDVALDLTDVSTVVARSAGFPSSTYRSAFCADFDRVPEALSAYLDAQVFNTATQVITPAVLLAFDGAKGIFDAVKTRRVQLDLPDSDWSMFDEWSENISDTMVSGRDHAARVSKPIITANVAGDADTPWVPGYYSQVQRFVDANADDLADVPRAACAAGQTGGADDVDVLDVRFAAASSVGQTVLAMFDREDSEFLKSTAVFIIIDVLHNATQMVEGLHDPMAFIQSLPPSAYVDLVGEILVGTNPLGWLIGTAAGMKTYQNQWASYMEVQWRYEPAAFYAVRQAKNITTVDPLNVDWDICGADDDLRFNAEAAPDDSELGSIHLYPEGSESLSASIYWDDVQYGDVDGDGRDDAVAAYNCIGANIGYEGAVVVRTPDSPTDPVQTIDVPMDYVTSYTGALTVDLLEDGAIRTTYKMDRDAECRGCRNFDEKVTDNHRLIDGEWVHEQVSIEPSGPLVDREPTPAIPDGLTKEVVLDGISVQVPADWEVLDEQRAGPPDGRDIGVSVAELRTSNGDPNSPGNTYSTVAEAVDSQRIVTPWKGYDMPFDRAVEVRFPDSGTGDSGSIILWVEHDGTVKSVIAYAYFTEMLDGQWADVWDAIPFTAEPA